MCTIGWGHSALRLGEVDPRRSAAAEAVVIAEVVVVGRNSRSRSSSGVDVAVVALVVRAGLILHTLMVTGRIALVVPQM